MRCLLLLALLLELMQVDDMRGQLLLIQLGGGLSTIRGSAVAEVAKGRHLAQLL